APGETPRNPPLPQSIRPQSVRRSQPTPQLLPFPCAGRLHTVHVTDPDFLDGGGSPYEGQLRPTCETRLVTVKKGRSSTPNFFFFTDVPLPGRIHGLITDDLNLSTNPKEL